MPDRAGEYRQSGRGGFPRRRLQRPPCGVALAPGILEGRAEITLGSRFGTKNEPSALPWHQAFGNRLAADLIGVLYRVKVSDLDPFRAGHAESLRALELEE